MRKESPALLSSIPVLGDRFGTRGQTDKQTSLKLSTGLWLGLGALLHAGLMAWWAPRGSWPVEFW